MGETRSLYFLNFETPFYDLLIQKAEKSAYKVFLGGQDKPEQNMNLCRMVGRHFGLTEDEIMKGVSRYNASQRRLNIHSLNDIVIVDDTYNANPDGVLYALQYCRRFEGRKLFVLGDMLELGRASKKAHSEISKHALDNDVSLIFAYGSETAVIKSKEVPVFHFHSKAELHQQLLTEIKGDVIIVKGSRGMKMEETVDIIQKV